MLVKVSGSVIIAVFLSTLVGIFIGIISAIRKYKAKLNITGIIINFIILALVVTALYPD